MFVNNGKVFLGAYQVTGKDYVAEKVSELAGKCPAGDDYTRALWVHDYLATHTYYD